MKFFITNLLISVTDKIKPVLIKFFTIEFLRRTKRSLVNHSMKALNNFHIEPFKKGSYPDGINLIGYIKAEIGLGQSARLIASVLEHINYPFSLYNYDQITSARNTDSSWNHKITNSLVYNINLIHINPHEMPLIIHQFPKTTWNKRYNIGFWLWELEEFPDEWADCINILDEIWTPSEFSSVSIQKKTSLPVKTIPYYLTAPTNDKFDRKYFQIPENQFLFLTMADSNSMLERKNPMGVIQSYKLAFPKENSNVGIIIKVNNPQKKDLDYIYKELEGYRNVYLIHDILTKVEVNSLIKCANVFVSLHRAEGFGLPPAEAMYVGTPVISTNWSATAEFMTQETACLVDFNFIDIENDIGPYKKGNRWADPCVDKASRFMIRLYKDRDFYKRISINAQIHIRKVLSMEQATEKINRRINEIYAEIQNIK